jgi:hypothetical protein
MSDQGILAVAPVNQGAGPPPALPADSSDVGSPRGSEDALLQEAMGVLEGGEEGAAADEGPKPQEKPKPAEEQTQTKLSAAYAKLAAREERHDRRVAEQTAKFQSERASFEAELAELAPLKEAKAKAASSPLEALQLLGWGYKDLVDYVMADGKIPPEKFAERLSQQQKAEIDAVKAELEGIKKNRQTELEAYEAQQEVSRIEHQTKQLFAGDDSPGAEHCPLFYSKFSESPENAAQLMVDVQSVLTTHYNQTCVRDPQTGRIIKPGEKLDVGRAVVYLEGILAKMQIRPRNPGQPGAVTQTANAGAARQQAPKPLTPRDLSVTSMPSEAELAAMSQEETEALALRIMNGG